MKAIGIIRTALLAAVFLAANILQAAGDNDANDRTWTTKSGSTLEAEFIKYENGRVTLKTTDGKTMGIGLSSLIDDDQAFVKEVSSKPRKLSTTGLSSSSSSSGMLSEEELKNLSPTWTDEKSGDKRVMRAGFAQERVSPTQKKRYQRSGKIPFRIIADVTETQAGARRGQRMSGSCKIYILDSENKCVDKKSTSLDSMCPT